MLNGRRCTPTHNAQGIVNPVAAALRWDVRAVTNWYCTQIALATARTFNLWSKIVFDMNCFSANSVVKTLHRHWLVFCQSCSQQLSVLKYQGRSARQPPCCVALHINNFDQCQYIDYTWDTSWWGGLMNEGETWLTWIKNACGPCHKSHASHCMTSAR